MSKCPLWPDNEVDKLPKVTCISAKKIRAEKQEIFTYNISRRRVSQFYLTLLTSQDTFWRCFNDLPPF